MQLTCITNAPQIAACIVEHPNCQLIVIGGLIDPVVEYWATHGKPDTYEAGTWGPPTADRMLARDGRAWRRP